MTRFLDARIPVAFGPAETALPADMLLVEEGAPSPDTSPIARFATDPAHNLGCACCTGRSAAARALSTLFLDRARNRCPFFTRVLVVAPSDAAKSALSVALAEDVLVAQWFRLAKPE